MEFSIAALPDQLREKVLLGGVGRLHLTGMARDSLSMAGVSSEKRLTDAARFYADMGRDMLLAAWEDEPLSGTLIQPLGTVTRGVEWLPSAFFEALDWVSTHWKEHERIRHFCDQGKVDKARQAIDQTLDRDPSDLYALYRGLELALVDLETDWILARYEALQAGPADCFRQFVLADLHLLSGDPERAEACYLRGLEECPLPGLHTRLATALLRQGKDDQALPLMAKVLRQRPWNTSLLLTLHDRLAKLHSRRALLDGPLAVCLYSWNKSDDLERALLAMEKAGFPDNLRIAVVDNGSTDATPALLSTWRDKLGQDRFEVLTAPVNMGAPAARNWLMRSETVRASQWTIYLDDDALVPPGWIDKLGAAVDAFPQAGVWGCKVVDHGREHVIQNADLHLRPEYSGSGQYQGKVGLSTQTTDLHHQTFDFGQFDHLRPCVSVTGCCHLFRTEVLRECGDFDICFSPTQFDDLDHDLCLARSGKTAVYQGHLTVGHLKHTGEAARRGGVASGNGLGNHLKLTAKHQESVLAQVRKADMDIQQEFVKLRRAALDVMLDAG